jgi:hypothetical protein
MASNKQMTQYLSGHVETTNQALQGVADAAKSDEMVKFMSAAIGFAEIVHGIFSKISDRQAAAITTEIAPTAIDHADQASDDGDTVAAVVQSAEITTDEGTAEANTERANAALADAAVAQASSLAEERPAETTAVQDVVLKMLKEFGEIQGVELATTAQLLAAIPISTLPLNKQIATTDPRWKALVVAYPVSKRSVTKYISPPPPVNVLLHSKRKTLMYLEEVAKAGGDPIAGLHWFLRRYKAEQEEQKQAKRSAGGLQEVEQPKRTRKSPPPLLTPAVAGAAVAVQPQATSGGPLLAAGLPASISQSSAESEDGFNFELDDWDKYLLRPLPGVSDLPLLPDA